MADDFQMEFKDEPYQPSEQQMNNNLNRMPTGAESVPSTTPIVMGFDIFMCGLAVGFKAAAILFYFVLKMVGQDLLTFVFVLLLTVFDFWTTKNLTGRKLVGLRWWSQINEQDNEEEWVFESCDPNRQINETNSNVFWAAQFIISTFWLIITLINIITLSIFWSALAIFSAFLSSINLYCYFKCRGGNPSSFKVYVFYACVICIEHQKKIKSLAQSVGIKFLQNQVS